MELSTPLITAEIKIKDELRSTVFSKKITQVITHIVHVAQKQEIKEIGKKAWYVLKNSETRK